jgi:hypothetical protein
MVGYLIGKHSLLFSETSSQLLYRGIVKANFGIQDNQKLTSGLFERSWSWLFKRKFKIMSWSQKVLISKSSH